MTTTNGLKYEDCVAASARSSGHVNGLERDYLVDLGATADGQTTDQMWLEVFLANGATSTNWNEAAVQFLVALGYSGSLAEMWNLYWQAVGSSYVTTAKAIEGEAPSYESYDKTPMWSGANGGKFTYASFMRIPHAPANGAPTFFVGADGYLWFALNVWNDTDNSFRMNFTGATVGNYQATTLGIATHGIAVGDWFALMFSIDYSAATPLFNVYVHKKGDASATDIFDTPIRADAGPATLPFDNGSDPSSLNSYRWGAAQSLDSEIAEVYMTDEYVDWSDSATRALYVDGNGKPVGLGADGSGLTGTAAKIYLPDGDGTNNLGTAGNFTAVGTISDAATSPTDA